MRESHYDVAILGGGTGGCAAALAVLRLGLRAVMTEPTRWIGGQLTSQAVPPDEHPWIETTGCTATYREYRDRVRAHYRRTRPLTPTAYADTRLNPGEGWVSRLCHEPAVGVAVLTEMLSPYLASGQLTLRLETAPIQAEVEGDRVRAVIVDGAEGREALVAPMFLDATETGDLLPLAGVEYVRGAESVAETGEPHAHPTGDPEDQQGITWCFAMGYDPEGDHRISRPEGYARWSALRPPFWPGPLLGWVTSHPVTLQETRWSLFPTDENPLGLFHYRRILDRSRFVPGAEPEDVTLVNWPQNDYFEAPIVDVAAEIVAERLAESRELSQSLLYWLQHDAPRPDGGTGWPGLHMRPDLMGTTDGMAMAPYIRESRRIRAVVTVREQDVAADLHPGRDRAPSFPDSVGVGCYRIDLHPSTAGRNSIDIGSLPFEIPLGALLPVRVENLLPAAKNLGVTHITNGCFRLHPVEWNIGEAAGALAAFALATGVPPRAVREDPIRLEAFQARLDALGVQRRWPALRPV